jgi:hypothetical protein
MAPDSEGEMDVDAGPSSDSLRRSGRKKAMQSYCEEGNEDGDKEADQRVRSHDCDRDDDPDFDTGDDVRMGGGDDPPVEVKEESQDQFLRFTPAPGIEGHSGQQTDARQTVFDVDAGADEKPKLAVRLKYQGFTIAGRCLCIVVEPWPPMRGVTPAAARAPTPASVPRAPSVTPGPSHARSKTPLFLPDDDDERRSVTPAPSALAGMRVLPPVPHFDDRQPNDDDGEGEEDEGMMQLSQILNSTGSVMRGNMEDDDEFEGAVLFADADEARELE